MRPRFRGIPVQGRDTYVRGAGRLLRRRGPGRVRRRDFRTEDRRYADPGSGELVRTPWSTPVAAWRPDDGRLLPTSARATWLRPEGDQTYAEIAHAPGDLVLYIPPRDP